MSTREQLHTAYQLFATIVLAAPIIFQLGHWWAL